MIFLVGFMGSGKSAVGRILADRLARPFEDTDTRVEEQAGCSIEEIFRTQGEGRFREMEWDVLRSVAAEGAVVATGGGLFLGVVQRRHMKEHGVVVWLDAPLAVVRERIGAGAGRPLWSSGDPVRQRAFFEKRRAAYALADLRIESGGAYPEAIAARCARRLGAVDR